MQSKTAMQKSRNDGGGGERERKEHLTNVEKKGQPSLQLMPCSGEEEGKQDWKKKDLPGGGGRETLTKRGKRERASSGGNRGEKTVREKLYNTNRETVLVWLQRAAGGNPEVKGRVWGTVGQSHRSLGWAGRRKMLWFLFFSSSSSDHHCVSPCSPPYPPPLHR